MQNLMEETGRLETQERLAFHIQRQLAGRTLFSLGEASLCSVQVTNPHYGEQPDLLKVHWFKCKSHSKIPL